MKNCIIFKVNKAETAHNKQGLYLDVHTKMLYNQAAMSTVPESDNPESNIPSNPSNPSDP